MNVSLIFDIGKTNKKLFLFDDQYRIIGEETIQFDLIRDEDGDPCEDITRLSRWVIDSFLKMVASKEHQVSAVNVAAYGASFVHVDKHGTPVTPLYNYLKPFPTELLEPFYDLYGGRLPFSIQTASPPLGNLNSGLQVFRLKKQSPNTFTQVHYSIHLPQFIASLIHGEACSDLTSIGCHTALWDFSNQKYHRWVEAESILSKLPPIVHSDKILEKTLGGKSISVGVGLHDSSSALIPYLKCFKEKFILISSGTWNISLNPFNKSPLTEVELLNDCLCYMDYHGSPVKASRLFAGNEHEQQTTRIAEFFSVNPASYKTVEFNATVSENAKKILAEGHFASHDISRFKTFEEAYHGLMIDIVSKQWFSTQMVIDQANLVVRIFVDGGFSQNAVFMNLLARKFAGFDVCAASVPQATAMGAAMAIRPDAISQIPSDLIKLTHYNSAIR